MLDRRKELAIAIDNRWNLLRVHAVNPRTNICSCRDPECKTPGKHPIEAHGVRSARAYNDIAELGQCNIGVACGHLVVVDIDPRNGGTSTLRDMIATHGDFTNTVSVSTGGGGLHLYFYADGRCKSNKAYSHRGIDIQGDGAYVLLPTSIHSSGRWYEWCNHPDDVCIQNLPKWLYPSSVSEAGVNSNLTPTSIVYTLSELNEALRSINASCDYSTWIRVGMACKAAGMSMSNWDSWSQLSSKYPGIGAIERKWNSFKNEGAGAGSLIYLAQEAGWKSVVTVESWYEPEVAVAVTTEVVTVEKKTPESHRLLDLCPPGLLKDIANYTLNSAFREYSNVALATAFACVATCAQSSVLLEEGMPLSLYQVVLMEASAGKKPYLNAVKDILGAVDRRLICAELASNYGLLAELYCWNSRIFIRDEIQDFLGKVAGAQNVFLSEIISTIKELFDGPSALYGSAIKASCMPDILYPKFSLYGVGTPDKFKAMMNSDMFDGGFISRLMIWQEDAVAGKHGVKLAKDVPRGIVEQLSDLVGRGLTQSYPAATIEDFQEARKKVYDPKAKLDVHIPQNYPGIIGTNISYITSSKDAEDYKVAKHRSYEQRLLAREQHASIWDRSVMQAKKLAGLTALSRGSTIISVEDMKFGFAVMEHITQQTIADAKIYAVDDPVVKLSRRIEAYLDSTVAGGISARNLCVSMRCKRSMLDEALKICDCILTDSNGLTIDLDKKIPSKLIVKKTKNC